MSSKNGTTYKIYCLTITLADICYVCISLLVYIYFLLQPWLKKKSCKCKKYLLALDSAGLDLPNLNITSLFYILIS